MPYSRYAPVLAGLAAFGLSAGATAQITDDNPTDLSGRGDFGGLVIDGFAPVNNANANGEASSEVDRDLQDGFRFFGGGDVEDSSGSISYLVIAESGVTFRPDEEIQGLTLEGVGNGTTISYLQVLGSEDDGFETFGGAADFDHIVVNGADDDSFDIDLGYRGHIQFALARQGADNGDRGIESDGNGDNFDALPLTQPQFANITILGNAGRQDAQTVGALHREGFGGRVFRSVYSDDTLADAQFENGCLDIDDQLRPALMYRDVIFNCSPQPLAAASATDDEDPSLQQMAVDNGQVQFVTPADVPGFSIDPETFAVSTGDTTPVTVLPQQRPPEQRPANPDDAVPPFQPTAYFGAVDPAAVAPADPSAEAPEAPVEGETPEGPQPPFWFGWTAHVEGGDGSLINQNIHPLANNVGADITPAASSQCTSIDADFTDGGTVDLFGETFPVCVIGADALSNQDGSDAQPLEVNLTNDHAYLLDGFVEVGDGGGEAATPDSVTEVVLNIEAGTEIFGATATDGSLIITRGSDINVNGTAQMPVVMSGVETNL